MPQGISADVLRKIKMLFVSLEVFASNQSLTKFFDRPSLKPWKYEITEMDTVRDRVESFISDFYHRIRAVNKGENWYDGLNVLEIFLIEIYQNYQTEQVLAFFAEFPELKAKAEKVKNS